MTGVGFGNVSAATESEKLFSVFMMIIGCKFCSFFWFYHTYYNQENTVYRDISRRSI
jgi:hypothetical protein